MGKGRYDVIPNEAIQQEAREDGAGPGPDLGQTSATCYYVISTAADCRSSGDLQHLKQLSNRGFDSAMAVGAKQVKQTHCLSRWSSTQRRVLSFLIEDTKATGQWLGRVS